MTYSIGSWGTIKMINSIILVLMLSYTPPVLIDRDVYIIEINTVVNAEGEPQFTQLVLWDDDFNLGDHLCHVRDWRMICRYDHLEPYVGDFETDFVTTDTKNIMIYGVKPPYHVTFLDTETLDEFGNPCMRKIYGLQIWWTYTLWDVETDDRLIVGTNKRRKLLPYPHPPAPKKKDM